MDEFKLQNELTPDVRKEVAYGSEKERLEHELQDAKSQFATEIKKTIAQTGFYALIMFSATLLLPDIPMYFILPSIVAMLASLITPIRKMKIARKEIYRWENIIKDCNRVLEQHKQVSDQNLIQEGSEELPFTSYKKILRKEPSK
jgi:hypothetical protein